MYNKYLHNNIPIRIYTIYYLCIHIIVDICTQTALFRNEIFRHLYETYVHEVLWPFSTHAFSSLNRFPVKRVEVL